MKRVSALVSMSPLGPNVSLIPRILLSNQKRSHTDTRVYADAFIRDELSKGRYDPALTKLCNEMMFELFGRTLKVELGESDGKEVEIEDVC